MRKFFAINKLKASRAYFLLAILSHAAYLLVRYLKSKSKDLIFLVTSSIVGAELLLILIAIFLEKREKFRLFVVIATLVQLTIFLNFSVSELILQTTLSDAFDSSVNFLLKVFSALILNLLLSGPDFYI